MNHSTSTDVKYPSSVPDNTVHNFEVCFDSAVVGMDGGSYTKKDRKRKQKTRNLYFFTQHSKIYIYTFKICISIQRFQ